MRDAFDDQEPAVASFRVTDGSTGAHQPKHTPRKLESAAGITRLHQLP